MRWLTARMVTLLRRSNRSVRLADHCQRRRRSDVRRSPGAGGNPQIGSLWIKGTCMHGWSGRLDSRLNVLSGAGAGQLGDQGLTSDY